MPAKKAPSAKETPNSAAAPKATPSAMASTASAEQLARAGVRDVVQHPRHEPPADDQHQRDEGRDLGQRDGRASAQRSRRPRRRPMRRRVACRPAGRRGPAAAPAPAPWPDPRRSASRPRCGRARCRAGGAPAAPAAARRCWRPTAPGRRPGRRRRASPGPGQRHAQQRSRRRSGRWRREWRSPCTDSRSFSEKCRPTPNISRMTPISASSGASAWSATKPGVKRADQHAGDEIADQRRQPQAVGQRAEHEGEPEAGDDGRRSGACDAAWAERRLSVRLMLWRSGDGRAPQRARAGTGARVLALRLRCPNLLH